MRSTAVTLVFATFLLISCRADRGSTAASGEVRDPAAADSVPPAVPVDTIEAVDSGSVLTADGWAQLRIGMTRDEVVAAAGADANPDAVGGPDPESCDELRPERAPEGMIVMIEDGRLTRIAITGDTGIRTDRGFGIGDSAVAIRRAYGSDAVITPHFYRAAPAEYITVWSEAPPSPDARGVVYEIDTDARVLRILAGGRSIEYVEGCV